MLLREFVAMKDTCYRRAMRRALLGLAQKQVCFYCQREIWGNEGTIDHLIPRCLGGPDEDWNIVLAHTWCNHEKNDRMPTDEEMNRRDELEGIVRRLREVIED